MILDSHPDLDENQGSKRSHINYSDGDAVEERLLSIVRSTRDLSCASGELREHLIDWPSKYHLGPERHCLLRPFTFTPGQRVLELGAGCGAITRYLGETGAEVVAVEGSPRRTAIARERCRDLPNVSVQCNNLMDFHPEERFDVVTLIGVLEYAPCYIDAPDPAVACLNHARSLLKTDGALILAIENRLGLKYFNGHAEDHLGRPYYGIFGLYGRKTPVTFGRVELSQRLRDAGFHGLSFYFPFPDYKHPQLVITESALQAPGVSIPSLLALMASQDQTGHAPPVFHEPLAWEGIIANDLLPDLSNSFLVLASPHHETLTHFKPKFLACGFNASRHAAYATQTALRHDSTGCIVVEKAPLWPELPTTQPMRLCDGVLLHSPKLSSPYVPGSLYIIELQRRMARDEGIDAVIDWAHDWLDLVKSARIGGSMNLPGNWIDAIPQNFIRAADGSLTPIDTEWSVSSTIPISWVIFRGLMHALAVCPTSPALSRHSLLEILHKTVAASKIEVDDEAIRQACVLEADLRAIVLGKNRRAWELQLVCHLSEPQRSTIGAPTLKETYEALDQEIRRVKTSVSWQVTKPLRLLSNLLSLPIAWLQHRRD